MMNRPELKNFSAKGMTREEIYKAEFNRWRDFANDLEKYLNELEKALDKACEELSSKEYEIEMMKNPYAYDCVHKDCEQWKEWCLKDE